MKPQDQPITAFPEVKKRELTKGCDFMILACDGIWEGKSSQEVVDFVYAKLKKHPHKLSTVIEDLFNELVSPNFVTTGKFLLMISGCRMRQHDLCYHPVQIFILIAYQNYYYYSLLQIPTFPSNDALATNLSNRDTSTTAFSCPSLCSTPSL